MSPLSPQVIILQVAMASPSLNTTTGHHWSRYRKLKKLWERELWVAKINGRHYGAPMIERAKIHIRREGKKLLDKDNLVGGMKPIIDSLKVLGFIVDDSPAHIDLSVEQRVALEPSTLITIQEFSTPPGEEPHSHAR